jgi:hypothetical protein
MRCSTCRPARVEAHRVQHGQPLVNSEYGPWSGGTEMDLEIATPFRYITEVRTIVYFTNSLGRQVSRRLWVISVTNA